MPAEEMLQHELHGETAMSGLWRAFDAVGMKLLDIGARGGSLPWLGFFAPFSIYYGCEPDASAAAGLSRLLRVENPWRDCVVITEAMGSKPGLAKLHLTRHPGFSSVMKPNFKVVREFGLENEFTVEETIEVPMITLEEAAGKYGFEDVAFIKLDTQGSELDILKSGAELLRESVQAVFVEVEFRQFYQRQPLFSEIEKFLRRSEFQLLSIDQVTRRRTTTGMRVGYSRRELTWGHALFMKAFPHSKNRDEKTLYEQLIRQIAIAVASEHFDLAAERLIRPDCASILNNAGLNVTLEELETYIAKRVSVSLYREFRKNWSEILKDRARFYT